MHIEFEKEYDPEQALCQCSQCGEYFVRASMEDSNYGPLCPDCFDEYCEEHLDNFIEEW